MSNLSRRHLLKTAAAGSTLFAGALTTAHATPIEPMPQKWDETFDIVVIGSGFAGLAAAIEARKNGQQADAARLHLAEQWREKLLSAAEADVEDLLAAFPWPDAEAAGRPELEKLLAEARKEDDRRPPHARRALFRGIMRLLEQR